MRVEIKGVSIKNVAALLAFGILTFVSGMTYEHLTNEAADEIAATIVLKRCMPGVAI